MRSLSRFKNASTECKMKNLHKYEFDCDRWKQMADDTETDSIQNLHVLLNTCGLHNPNIRVDSDQSNTFLLVLIQNP